MTGRWRGFKKLLAVAGLVGLFAIGYTATSVVTSCTAEAQLCCAGQCMLFEGITAPLTAISAQNIIAGIGWIMATTGIYYVAVLAEFMVKVYQQIGLNINHWLDWWNTMWFYNFNPALQDMTRQLVVLDADQARAIGAFNDMLARNNLVGNRAERESQSHITQHPSENVCVAGTLSGGMVQADVFTDAYNAAAGADALPRAGNLAGTPAAAGTAAENNARYQNYVSRYCDPDENAGINDCTTAAPRAGLDRDVTGQIFQKETIDLKNTDVKKTIDDLVTNIAEPFVRDPVPIPAVASAEGQSIALENESYKAQRQVIYDSLYHVVARRAPTSSLATFTVEIHQAAGVPVAMRETDGEEPALAEAEEGQDGFFTVRRAHAQKKQNEKKDDDDVKKAAQKAPLPPSKNEVTNVMAAEASATGDFAARQIDEPENNAREAVVQEGVRMRQLTDMLDLTDRYSLIVAGQVGNELNQSRPQDTKSSVQPLR